MVTINVQISTRTHTTWKLYLLIVTDFISDLKDTGNCVAEESIFLTLDEEEVLRRKKAAYHAVMRRKQKKKRLLRF